MNSEQHVYSYDRLNCRSPKQHQEHVYSSATYTFGALEAVAPQPARPHQIPKKKKTCSIQTSGQLYIIRIVGCSKNNNSTEFDTLTYLDTRGCGTTVFTAPSNSEEEEKASHCLLVHSARRPLWEPNMDVRRLKVEEFQLAHVSQVLFFEMGRTPQSSETTFGIILHLHQTALENSGLYLSIT